MKKMDFPKGFLWGAATSAHQVEGNNKWNDWWKFEQETNIQKSGLSSDHYNLYEKDFDIAQKKLNLNAQRLSIEWSRIEKIQGNFDKIEIEHYREVLKYLKDNDFKTMVTLHHFTNPTWFNEIGSWDKKGNEEYFIEFVKVAKESFDDLVDFWVTFNEPVTPYSTLGFLRGIWPPQKKSIFSFYKANKAIIKAHQKAYEILKSKKDNVGIAYNIATHFPKYFFEIPFKPFLNYVRNWWFLNQVVDYCDFIGVNYYFPLRVGRHDSETDMGWEINENGFYDALTKVWNKYGKTIYVTENGAADNEDRIREHYIKIHVRAMWEAINDGADVKGYFHWSLLDNFEWTSGYGQCFGLIKIDYKNLKRTVRKSALFYAEIAKNNSLKVD